MARSSCDVVAHHGEQALARRQRAVAGDLRHRPEQPLAEPVDEAETSARLPGEVPVDRRLGEPDPLGEPLHRQVGQPRLRHQLRRPVEDLGLARGGRVVRLCWSSE